MWEETWAWDRPANRCPGWSASMGLLVTMSECMEGRELSLVDPSPQSNWHCSAECSAKEGVSLSAAPGFPSVGHPRWWWTAYQWPWLLTSWNIVSVYVMRVWPPVQLYSLARLSVVRTLTLAFPHSVQMNSQTLHGNPWWALYQFWRSWSDFMLSEVIQRQKWKLHLPNKSYPIIV